MKTFLNYSPPTCDTYTVSWRSVLCQSPGGNENIDYENWGVMKEDPIVDNPLIDEPIIL
jgi:hypothetical protein